MGVSTLQLGQSRLVEYEMAHQKLLWYTANSKRSSPLLNLCDQTAAANRHWFMRYWFIEYAAGPHIPLTFSFSNHNIWEVRPIYQSDILWTLKVGCRHFSDRLYLSDQFYISLQSSHEAEWQYNMVTCNLPSWHLNIGHLSNDQR